MKSVHMNINEYVKHSALKRQTYCTHTHTHTHTHTNTENRVCQLLSRCESVMELRVHTDKEVMENRPDTIIKNQRKKEKRCKPTDVTIPADRNITQKEAE